MFMLARNSPEGTGLFGSRRLADGIDPALMTRSMIWPSGRTAAEGPHVLDNSPH